MTRQSALRRTGLFLLACVLAAVLAVPVLAAGIPDAPDAYVYDEAGVLSDSTEQYINLETAALDEACGGQIAVVAVEFTGAYSTADYAYELFNAWGIGDRNENNGLLLLLVTGAEDYYIMPGSGVTDIFSGGTLQTLMDDYLEADFAAGNYDAGVRKTFDRIMEIYGKKYDLTPTSASDAGYSGYADAEDSLFSRFFRVIGKILIVAILVVLVIVLIRFFAGGPRGGGGGYGGGGGGGFWNGLLLGSLLNRRRYTYRPPPPHFGGPRPPRPPHVGRPGGGFGGGRPGGFGGFGGGRTGGFGGFGGGRTGGFGGFGGGGSRGGGAGRR